MKINIQIEDASPADLKSLFGLNHVCQGHKPTDGLQGGAPVQHNTPPAKQTGKKHGGRLIACPYCSQEIDSHGMHMHVSNKHPEKFEEWKTDPDRLGHGVGKKASKPKAKPARVGSNADKWHIPFSTKTQPAEYRKARAMCLFYNLPYPEALKKAEEEKKKAPVQKGPAPAESAETSTSSGQSSDNVVTLDKFSPNENIVGWHVKQVKPDQGRQIFGTGKVVARRSGGIIEVRNGGGKLHKIDARCLAVIPPVKEGEATAEGGTA